jgi:Fe-S oxidoreductase
LSKVQKYPPSKIIQLILEGFEEKVLNSGVLWDCLTCNQCLKDCPEKINFADIVRIARYKMRHEANQNPEELIAHKGIYTTIAEIMSRAYIEPKRSLKWVPKGCKITNKGDILYYVGCLPFYEYEFEDPLSIAQNALKIICQIEKNPIAVLEEEICCGHDIYWGQGKLKTFINLAQKNIEKFEKTGATTIITACAECYRTFKIDYAKIFQNMSSKFEIKHLIEYVYDKWKQNEIRFKKPPKTDKVLEFTYHDPCRTSRFLPEEINLMGKVREIFAALSKLGYTFTEMKHNKSNSLCCGVNSWMNCNEKSKALRYKRMLEAKTAAPILVTSCPKCEIHFECLQNDFEDIAEIQILDFSEFISDKIELTNPKTKGEKKK